MVLPKLTSAAPKARSERKVSNANLVSPRIEIKAGLPDAVDHRASRAGPSTATGQICTAALEAPVGKLPTEVRLHLFNLLPPKDFVALSQSEPNFLRDSYDRTSLQTALSRFGCRARLESLDNKQLRSLLLRTYQLQHAYTVGYYRAEQRLMHFGPVYAVSFSADSRFILARFINRVRILEVNQPSQPPIELLGHSESLTSACFSDNGRFVVTTALDNQAILYWDYTTKRPSATRLSEHTDYVMTARFSADSACLLTSSFDRTAKLWDLRYMPPISKDLIGHNAEIFCASFSPDNRHIITGSKDTTAMLWDRRRPSRPIGVLQGHTDSVRSISFSPDGRRVATTSFHDGTKIWDLTKLPPIGVDLSAHTRSCHLASFSPDGRLFITAGKTSVAWVWDLTQTPFRGKGLVGHTSAILSASFSPDSNFALTASENGCTKIWDLSEDLSKSIDLPHHTAPVYRASFSPCGRYVATGSEDKTVCTYGFEYKK